MSEARHPEALTGHLVWGGLHKGSRLRPLPIVTELLVTSHREKAGGPMMHTSLALSECNESQQRKL